jgi:hypothetical protein
MLASPALQDLTHTTAHIKQYRHGNSFRTVTTICAGWVSRQVKESYYLPPRLDQRYDPPFLTHQNMGRRGSFSGYKIVDIIEVCYA